jgi:hypothetical protein
MAGIYDARSGAMARRSGNSAGRVSTLSQCTGGSILPDE